MDTTTCTYVYNGGSLSQMTVGCNTLTFAYDASGSPMAVDYNGTTFCYVTNLQGDIVAILNTAGTAFVTYTYDAWGNILTTSGSMATTLGIQNPLRYRGYAYDTELGLYYLQSRYYNPVIGRFLNADAYTSTGQGILGNDMFAYCLNNPVNMSDSFGTWPQWLEDAIDWVNENLAEPVKKFVEDITEDCKNFDVNNESEENVLKSKYFSSYKGTLVFRTTGDRSGSFGVLFITRETNNRAYPEDVVRHEYGHTKQLEQLGMVNYLLCIGIPSYCEWGIDTEYYRRPWEITADIYGGVQSRSYPGYEAAGFEYLENSRKWGFWVWLTID